MIGGAGRGDRALELTVTPASSSRSAARRSATAKGEAYRRQPVSNALNFTHQGTIELTVQYEPVTRTASIVVTDTGIGIAPEHHERIFEDFRQVHDSPSRQYGGTGLGLAICRRLATALGGRITLHSTVGQGSSFTLTIPVEAPQ